MDLLTDTMSQHPYVLALVAGGLGGLLSALPGLKEAAAVRVVAVTALMGLLMAVGLWWHAIDPDGHPYGGSAWSWSSWNTPMHVRVLTGTVAALAAAMARALAGTVAQSRRQRLALGFVWWVCLPACLFGLGPVMWMLARLGVHGSDGILVVLLLTLTHAPLLFAYTAACREQPVLSLGAVQPLLVVGAYALTYGRPFPSGGFEEADWFGAFAFALVGVWSGGVLGDVAQLALVLGRDRSLMFDDEALDGARLVA